MRRFCFRWTIAIGVQVIGYLNIVLILGIIVLYSVIDIYQNIALAVLPLLNLLWFF